MGDGSSAERQSMTKDEPHRLQACEHCLQSNAYLVHVLAQLDEARWVAGELSKWVAWDLMTPQAVEAWRVGTKWRGQQT